MKHIAQYVSFLVQRWGIYAAVGLGFVAVNVGNTVIPMLTGRFVDDINKGSLTYNELFRFIAVIMVISISIYFVSFYRNVWHFGTSLTMEKMLKNRIFEHMCRSNGVFFYRFNTAKLVSILSGDVPSIAAIASMGILGICNVFIMFPLYLYFMGKVNILLTLATLIPIPVIAVTVHLNNKQMRQCTVGSKAASDELSRQVYEIIGGARTIRAFLAENTFIRRFTDAAEKLLDANISSSRVSAIFWMVIMGLMAASTAIALGYGSLLVYDDQITVGQLTAFMMYVWHMTFPMFALGSLYNIVQQADVSAQRLNEAQVVEERKDGEVEVSQSSDVLIEARQLSFGYPHSEAHVLRNISFRLKAGGTVAVVGKSGSGKSTLIKLLLLQFQLAPGTLLVAGMPAESVNVASWRRQIAYVPQEHMLFSRSLYDNVAFGKRKATVIEVHEALRMASLQEDIARLKDGVDTLIGEGGVKISGGQKQRVAIARALLGKPRLLLLDDALSSVDTATESQILSHIRQERGDMAIFFATHRLKAASQADFIIFMDNGRIVQQGTHEQLMDTNPQYRSQFEYQQKALLSPDNERARLIELNRNE